MTESKVGGLGVGVLDVCAMVLLSDDVSLAKLAREKNHSHKWRH